MNQNLNEGGFLERLVGSIFSKGISKEAVQVIYLALFGTIVSLIALAFFIGQWNIHVIIMLCLAIGLLGSLTWFLIEYSSATKEQPKKVSKRRKKE
mmetsp:Transcript_8423/g.12815  ORF Transcript_8423/g.12815 Transcript_8423/m.12815 type:complete len:96 (+) Transcript_8423:50-337(+)